jgi:hypothetical protein
MPIIPIDFGWPRQLAIGVPKAQKAIKEGDIFERFNLLEKPLAAAPPR